MFVASFLVIFMYHMITDIRNNSVSIYMEGSCFRESNSDK